MEKERIEYIHDLNTFQVCNNEVYLRGVDNKGKDILLVFPANEILEWLDIGYIREKVIEHYSETNKEEHPDEKAIQDVDKIIEEIQEDEEEIQYSCCGDEITGALKDIQMCPTCKEHL